MKVQGRDIDGKNNEAQTPIEESKISSQSTSKEIMIGARLIQDEVKNKDIDEIHSQHSIQALEPKDEKLEKSHCRKFPRIREE